MTTPDTHTIGRKIYEAIKFQGFIIIQNSTKLFLLLFVAINNFEVTGMQKLRGLPLANGSRTRKAYIACKCT